MKNITKGNEPQSLREHRAINPEDYRGYREKDELRNSLCAEQRGICCYCMGRIRPVSGGMKIEHWQSHERARDQRLVYSNLLGACMGGEGYRHKDQHCDTYKEDRHLSRNPANPSYDVEAIIQYGRDGSVTATDQLLNEQLNSVLNLNLPFLKANRKAALDAFTKFLRKRSGSFTRATWQRLLNRFDDVTTNSELEPYAGVIEYWIRRHLLRASP